jgi:heat shock protein HspQ
MVNAMSELEAKFQVGQIVHHMLFAYIGVIFDVDPEFQGTDEWYQHVARSRPPNDEPWYHVLVNESVSATHVAEQNLESTAKPQRIMHPLTDRLFSEFDGERYTSRQKFN